MAPPKKRKPTPVGVASVQRSNTPIIVGSIVLVVILAVVAVVVVLAQSKGSEETADLAQWQPVTVSGTPFTKQPEANAADPAVGTLAPDLAGKSFDGTGVDITNDGRAKAVMFFAHWCQHCRAEAPKLSEWIKANKTKYNVDYYAIATGTSAQSPNYPPSEWLDSMKFPATVLVDDHATPAATAYGLASYPYLVFIGKDGKLVSRTSGEIGATAFGQYVAAAAGTAAAPAVDAAAAGQSSPASSEAPAG